MRPTCNSIDIPIDISERKTSAGYPSTCFFDITFVVVQLASVALYHALRTAGPFIDIRFYHSTLGRNFFQHYLRSTPHGILGLDLAFACLILQVFLELFLSSCGKRSAARGPWPSPLSVCHAYLLFLGSGTGHWMSDSYGRRQYIHRSYSIRNA